MQNNRGLVYVLVMLATAALIAACGDDDNPSDGGGGGGTAHFSAAWEGAWVFEILGTTCDGLDTLIDEVSPPQFLCEGGVISFGPFDIDVTCNGTVTSTTIDVTCDSMLTIEGCDVELDTDFFATRTGDNLVGNVHATFVVTGCEFDTTQCVDIEILGTRVDDGDPECDAVVTARAPIWELMRGIVPRRSQ